MDQETRQGIQKIILKRQANTEGHGKRKHGASDAITAVYHERLGTNHTNHGKRPQKSRPKYGRMSAGE